MAYLWVKWVHILSSTILFGTGLGIAFFMWRAHRSGDSKLIAATARTVVIADTCFTAPAIVAQLLSGLWLVHRLGLAFSTFWIKSALLLFVLVAACWLPVVWLQFHARDLAVAAVAADESLPPGYHRAMRWWFWLGWPAFAAVIVIFWLMVMKPS